MLLHSATAVILVNHSWLMMVAQIEENSFENKDKTRIKHNCCQKWVFRSPFFIAKSFRKGEQSRDAS